ncbi:tRNA (adenosine(37)-N6)-threonylcarbamoyltransferase complex dimerization subunit type 1 TsaB [Polynucleobacter sp. MWH-UH2A]|uniref:tRNA (adenosine(37)-N6)-threonylcarbamoyltransferase complex dimerization subunit type 1 TsaB n=1 Tax=Polynucleobacter sp. MWH-UH2A TaxID=1855617 RepID=UPI0020419E3C|nr:tRNA (adenosine(37)-N6)-threonylcarbamoyltransferase complex dimerization subunit type 1 TsaB [Polynucleobacter sp. MWH-UH2A]QWD63175.1 tRNA (adenosine(37)-N6)-threonylcarbamoyltransferase complex dimerization subunit type 1 TsaB [Polynucleobacter sp. MWH-UH2A]
MTRILAIDTSSAWCSVALSLGDSEPTFRHQPVAAGASQLLLPWIEELLLESKLAIADLDAVAVGVGPGAFTGVRLGVAAVQGLAVAANLPVIPVASLDSIAMQLIANPNFQKVHPSQFVIAIDARMDEIYWAKYEYKSPGIAPKRLGDIHLSSPESIDLNGAEYLAGSAIPAFGNRLFKHRELPKDRLDGDINVSALGVLNCAIPKFASGKHISVHELEPLYVRNKVALTTEEREQAFKKSE